MLGTTHQIRMLLSQLENNIRILLKEREKYAPEVENMKKEIEELKKENQELKTKLENSVDS
jgi:phage host-nuclease inhibitor protein Gam